MLEFIAGLLVSPYFYAFFVGFLGILHRNEIDAWVYTLLVIFFFCFISFTTETYNPYDFFMEKGLFLAIAIPSYFIFGLLFSYVSWVHHCNKCLEAHNKKYIIEKRAENYNKEYMETIAKSIEEDTSIEEYKSKITFDIVLWPISFASVLIDVLLEGFSKFYNVMLVGVYRNISVSTRDDLMEKIREYNASFVEKQEKVLDNIPETTEELEKMGKKSAKNP